ncbi:uncharacterized protein LOC141621577 isoform X2 [Silene latifolia]|uniref:uncharacterized protein LOC141621577 isoform X2 n=1 Tax=Silene latifolia TaxID=37657 RepID=UPI003D76DCD1
MAAPCASKIVDFSSAEASFPCNSDSICTDCWLCDQHRAQINDLSGNCNVKGASTDEMFRRRLSVSNETEQVERRMSDIVNIINISIGSIVAILLQQILLNWQRESFH